MAFSGVIEWITMQTYFLYFGGQKGLIGEKFKADVFDN